MDGETLMNCPENLKYNPESGVCDWDFNVACDVWTHKSSDYNNGMQKLMLVPSEPGSPPTVNEKLDIAWVIKNWSSS